MLGIQASCVTAPVELIARILLLKFLETGFGLLLVAKDLQSAKVWFVALQLAVMLSFGAHALAGHGLAGWQLLNAGTLLGLLAGYVWLLVRRPR